MRTRFQQGLDDLRQRLLRMGGLAEQAVDRARQAAASRADSAGFVFAPESIETMKTGEMFDLVACMGVTSTLIEDAAFLRAAGVRRCSGMVAVSRCKRRSHRAGGVRPHHRIHR